MIFSCFCAFWGKSIFFIYLKMFLSLVYSPSPSPAHHTGACEFTSVGITGQDFGDDRTPKKEIKWMRLVYL